MKSKFKRLTTKLKSALERAQESIRPHEWEERFFAEAPPAFLDLMSRYFRLSCEGFDQIPRRGPAIFVANHSGFSGLDAMILTYQIRQLTGRVVRVMTHHFWFKTKFTAARANKLGFVEAKLQNGIKFLKKKQAVLIFPEGELGNFKPSSQAYELQEFKRGFIRMALECEAPIIPIVVLGAEEANINLKQIDLPLGLKRIILPLPLNLLPLPSKWKIKVLPPIQLPYSPESLKDSELMMELADEIRIKMQTALNFELSRRGGVFF